MIRELWLKIILKMNKLRLHKAKAKNSNALQYLTFEFGMVLNDNISYHELERSRKNNLSLDELEIELNELATYIFNGKRGVIFHEYRQFPYIQHGNVNDADCIGLQTNYMKSDVYFIKFIKMFLRYSDKGYSFPSAKYIAENSTKTEYYDIPLSDMLIDKLL